MSSPLLAATDLVASWLERPGLVLLDARAGTDAAARFAAGHLRGARRIDLESDLAGAVEEASVGGRHPLPSLRAWAATLGALGIAPSSFVVVYDDADGANAAARAWWMLRAIGHDAVAVLDGGLDAARRAGWPVVTTAEPFAATPPYPVPDRWRLPIVGADVVEARREDPAYAVVDARAAARYRGETEPIDPIAGHVPGALNLPFADQLSPDGTFLARDALAKRYADLLGGRDADHAIVYCGSGVTACHLLVGMEHAGLGLAALYVGSWGEWCRQARPRTP